MNVNIESIVFQAASLEERLNQDLFNINLASIDEQLADHHLEHWCEVVARGDWELFQMRLGWDRLDLNAIRPILGALNPEHRQALPAWAGTLVEIIQNTSGVVKRRDFEIKDNSTDKLPFEEIFLPTLDLARRKLQKRLGIEPSLSSFPLTLLSEQACLTLEKDLLKKLVRLSERSIDLEFFDFRPVGHNVLNLLIGESEDCNSKIFYTDFVQKLIRDGLLTFFQKYPVLGKFLATTLDFWVESTAEFIQRLSNDLPELQQMFSINLLGCVTEIEPSLSDPHNQGRSVMILTFSSGVKLVYKPKNIDTEVTYNQFLTWCNQQGGFPLFKVLKIMNRQTYGWAEYVEQQPCQNGVDAQHFYERAGMLLCIMYTLRGTDCIYQNLIANSEYPVIVDTETIIYPEINAILPSSEIANIQNQQSLNSVLRTGLLPERQYKSDSPIAFDVSGLGNVEVQQTPYLAPHWKFMNTDQMYLDYEMMTIPLGGNVPILNERALSPNDFLDEIVKGFRQIYQFLIEQRTSLIADSSPLAAFKGKWVRFVFRKTRTYAQLLERGLHPSFLQSGVAFGIELDILSRTFLSCQETPDNWSVFQAEKRAIEQLDVPYFGTSTNSDALTSGVEESIEHFFKLPGYAHVISQLQALSEDDLDCQISIIQDTIRRRKEK